MTVHLSVWLSVCMYVCLTICLIVSQSVSQSILPSACQSACLSVCLSQLWHQFIMLSNYHHIWWQTTIHFPSIWPSLIYLSRFGSILFYSILILNFLIYPYIYFIIFYFYLSNFIDVFRERSAPHNYLMISRKWRTKQVKE